MNENTTTTPVNTQPSGEGNTPSPTTVTPSQVESHVVQAEKSAETQATKTGDEGWKSVADELKGLRSDIKELMAESVASKNQETPPTTPTPPTTQPVGVEVQKPPPETRKVRRGSRKVARKHG